MRKDRDVERFLYAEWERARVRSDNYNEAASNAIAETGDPRDGEYYERLADLAWKHSIEILEIIYDFEKNRVS